MLPASPKGKAGPVCYGVNVRQVFFFCFLPGFELVPYRVHRMDEACVGVGGFYLSPEFFDMAVDGTFADDTLVGVDPVHELLTAVY